MIRVLKELRVRNLEKRQLRNDIVSVFGYIKECHSEEDQERFSFPKEIKSTNKDLNYSYLDFI